MIEGYSVKDAAQVLGIPEARIWELVARGVLAGTQGPDGSWRIHLGQTRPPEPVVATAGAEARKGNDEPRRPNGGDGGERSAFRELLTEFRNLTERYGQALLALGEARGEVAALRSRVDLLEARVDLRLPGPRGGEPIDVAWQVAEDEEDDLDDEELRSEPEAPIEPMVSDAVVPESWAPAVEVDLTDPDSGPGHPEPEDRPSEPTEVEAIPGEIVAPSEDAEIGAARRVVAFAPAPVQPPEPATPASEDETPASEDESSSPVDGDSTPRRRYASSTHNALAGLADALARAVDPALSDLPGAGVERRGDPDAEPGGEPSDVEPEAASVLRAEGADEDEIEGADELEMAGSGWRPADGPTPEEGPTQAAGESVPAEEQQEPEAEETTVAIAPETTELDTDATEPPPGPALAERIIDDMGDDPFPDQAEITDDQMLHELVASGLPDDVEPFDWEYDVSEPPDDDQVESEPSDADSVHSTDATSAERQATVEPPSDEADPSAVVEPRPDETRPTLPEEDPESGAVESATLDPSGGAADTLESSPEEASEPHSLLDADDSAPAYPWPIAALEPPPAAVEEPPAEAEPPAAEPEAAVEPEPAAAAEVASDPEPATEEPPAVEAEDEPDTAAEPDTATEPDTPAEPESATAAETAMEPPVTEEPPPAGDELPAEAESPAVEPEAAAESESATPTKRAVETESTSDEEPAVEPAPPGGSGAHPSGEMELPGGEELRDALRALGIEGTAQSREVPPREAPTGTPPPPTPPEQQLSRPESEPPGSRSEPRTGSTPWSSRPLAADRRPPRPGEPTWLRNRRDPAASAFRRLRKLFPK